jgi:hypothetical protein
LRYTTARADDLDALRRRLARARAEPASDEERRLALELRELRERMTAQLGEVMSCTRCARGHPEPFGHWAGGHCCGSRTEVLFTEDEVRTLVLAGTTAARLTPPRGDLAGCAFRGVTGCSLAAADRPNLCVRYLCRELEQELAERPDGREVRRIRARLGSVYAEFQALRAGVRSCRAPWE